MATPAEQRPAVSVVVPFAGTMDDAVRCMAALAELELGPDDELILADNSDLGLISGAVRVVPARRERSSYYARNVGAEAAASDWILFMDSDCHPPASLLDAYFRAAAPDRCGILAGAVVADTAQGSTAARYARSRGHLDVGFHLAGEAPSGITANLLVRREAWESVGGFCEGIRSAGDVDFCWRVQRAGWTLESRPEAEVMHRHPDRVPRLRAKARRYGAGRRWLGRRYPEAPGRPPVLGPLVRCAAGALAWTLTARFERARFKLIDAGIVLADARGWLEGDNRARGFGEGGPGPTPRLAVVTDAFPARSETFIYNEMRALAAAGWTMRVESSSRPARIARDVARENAITYAEDEPTPGAVRDLLAVVARHPWRTAWDLAARRRWSREEPVWPLRALAPSIRRLERTGGHLHVHFAALAALNAMRCAHIAGATYSVEAHGYDIYQQPRNLPEKLQGAAFASGTCDYTVRELRARAGPRAAKRIHRIVMGVDADRFRRERPYPGTRKVIAVGRYVEKKGFEHLIEAASLMRERGSPPDSVLIVGDGPLASHLRKRIDELGVADLVELREAWGGDAVRRLLEDADVLAMPSVVASDGDRDSMPVVVKEALAMEVPVVGSDEVGIPEMIEPAWGRLVPPGNPEALAEAIEGILGLPAGERAAMGAAGRAFVIAHCNVAAETAKLSGLLAQVAPAVAPNARE